MINNNTFLLGDICEVIAGQSPPSSTYNKEGNGLPFFQGKADFGTFSPKVRVWCNAPQKIAKKGDILISVRAPVGPTNACDQDCCIGRGLSAIRAKDKVNSNYLGYFLKKREPILSGQGRGSTFSSITQKDLKEIKVSLPPLKEQKQIVQNLDKADSLRQKRKEQLKLLDDYLKSVFLEMFGDPTGLPEMQINELANKKKGSMRTGPFGSTLKHSEFVEQGIAVIGIDNAVDNEFKWKKLRFITNEKYQSLRQYTVYPGDVLITIMGTLGRSAVVPQDIPLAINTKHLACITLNKAVINPYFLSYSIVNDPYIMNQLMGNTRGAIMDGLNLTIIKNLKIKVPSLEMQNTFLTIMNKVKATKQKMRASLDEMDNHFSALMQRYLGIK